LSIELLQVDAFTDRPFGGNPAAVCLVDKMPDDDWMQALAAEMNLSETAFVAPMAAGGFKLRWFTPLVEVELCGHATLATAHALYTGFGVDDAEPLRFVTLSGELTATRTADGWIELDFPADAPVAAEPPDGLLEALGVVDSTVAVSHGRYDYLVELAGPELVRALAPDVRSLLEVETRGVMVTSIGDGLYDIVSRFFAPAAGIDEDPVTGSAHTTLGPYWSARLGKDDLLAHQASARGGVLKVGMRDDRVLIAGQAATVLRADLDPLSRPRRKKSSQRRTTS